MRLALSGVVVMKVGDLVEWKFDKSVGIGIVVDVKSYAASDRVVIQWSDFRGELPSNHPYLRKIS